MIERTDHTAQDTTPFPAGASPATPATPVTPAAAAESGPAGSEAIAGAHPADTAGTAGTDGAAGPAGRADPAGPADPPTPAGRGGVAGTVVAALGLVGVAGLAITQPVLDLFGRNPEFFIAGRYGSGQIVAFALIVGLVPGLVAGVVAIGARLIHPRLGTIVHCVLLAGLAFLFGLVLAGQVGLDGMWTGLLGAGVVAGVVVWLERTRQPMRTLLSYLALGNLVFVALFLFASPTAELVSSSAGASGEAGAVSDPGLQGPVVFVILDEFPVTTLMRPDGTINATRYPNFARLAGSSTWFRNASALSSLTSHSVPGMLSGMRYEKGQLPSYIDHPRNYFTLFGDRYPINLYESITDMCPPSACAPAKRESVSNALRDGVVVYGRQVLPGDLADDVGLPSVDHSWGSFGDELGAGSVDPAATEATPSTSVDLGAGAGDAGLVPAPGVPATTTTAPPPDAADVVGENGYGRWETISPDERRADGQLRVLRESLTRIGPEPSINFVHVVLPHYPWTQTPWGTQLTRLPANMDDMAGPDDREANGQLRYQLHSLQVAAVDAAVGEMIDHLEAVGAWDDALVVMTSDHGTSLFLPDFGRKASEGNREERLRMPLFVKAPGQVPGEGEVRDDVAQTIDILPSIVDLLGIETDWEFDGHSLYDGSSPQRAPEVDETVQSALDVAARHARDYGGEDWDGLAAMGIARDLHIVGRPVAEFTVGTPSAMTWTAADENLLASLPTMDGRVPYLVSGQVTTPGNEEPPEILLAVNGTIAGVGATHWQTRGSWEVMGMVGPHFRNGANTIETYEVELTPLGPVLHPLGSGSLG